MGWLKNKTYFLKICSFFVKKKEIEDLWRIYKVEGGMWSKWIEVVTNCDCLKIVVRYYRTTEMERDSYETILL